MDLEHIFVSLNTEKHNIKSKQAKTNTGPISLFIYEDGYNRTMIIAKCSL